jgi:hypothetical protein
MQKTQSLAQRMSAYSTNAIAAHIKRSNTDVDTQRLQR